MKLMRHSAIAALIVGTSSVGGMATAQEVTIVLPEQPANLEPCRSIRSDIGRIINMNITETLTIIEPETGGVAPHLATEWEQIDDTTWRFKLREGVEFQDGAPLNAEAVVNSINRLMNPNLTCDSRSKFGDVTLTPEVVDEYTFDIKSDVAIPIMPTLAGTMQIVSPNMPFDQEVNDPVGTGPYTLAEADNEHVLLQRNDNYWGETPSVTEATYMWRNESAIRAAMVETGEADLTPVIAVQDATDPEADLPYLNSETTRMRIDMSIPPLDDERVRRALNLAIDWDGMGEALFGPDVLRATQMVVPGVRGHNSEIEPYTYDPERAKALIDEARTDGVPVDEEITLIGRNGFFPNSSESLEAMQALWSEIGLNVTIEELEASDWARYLDKPFPEGRGPTLFQQQHDNNTGDAGFTAPVMYHSEGQYSTVANEELDKILDEAVSATGDERGELFQQAFSKVYEDIIGDVTMYHMTGYASVGPRLDWKPDLKTNSEIRLSDLKFK
ncbi:peptide/nickel transport system substrate-binding protein [Palleronia marisminoris]|uniref:Nickel-binding periplasmic protein n=1 Tax=Palleronia marisminoris TaxID=315423 RepID=A0A1Y5SQT4_9RHOB|nr:ABC transporter substrate-binding protein [Palleronia marisminoris]SFG92843.1 peptide/nickel transport system substrate-binding protein [Palleronia marisminoris]SLN44937.1 Nickel-binding periplasmic protein precursor [Palleronia marisminoris]